MDAFGLEVSSGDDLELEIESSPELPARKRCRKLASESGQSCSELEMGGTEEEQPVDEMYL
eukprot:4287663-Lingulodinium_polyedra.AAC.1